MIHSIPIRLAYALPPALVRPLRALGMLPPDTTGMFTGLLEELIDAWPREPDDAAEAMSPAARRARAHAHARAHLSLAA